MTLLSRIVKNEAMKSDPQEIYGWRVFMLACSGTSCINHTRHNHAVGPVGILLTIVIMLQLASEECSSDGTSVP
jgi:hypothetical protein